jgi:hypothetical protein
MAATIKASSKATSKRPIKPPAPVVVEESSTGAGFEPLRLTSSNEPAQRVPLFYINDVEYSVSARPGVNVALKYIHLFRTEGDTVATAYLLDRLLGSEGYQALMNYDDLTVEQFARICEIATQLTLGALEAPKA